MPLIRLNLCLAMMLTLAACGADGKPLTPEPKPAPGLTITGQATIGVGGSL